MHIAWTIYLVCAVRLGTHVIPYYAYSPGAVVMTPDSEGLGAAVVAGVGSKPHSVQWYFIFLPIHVFSEVLASVLILGLNSLLKFV